MSKARQLADLGNQVDDGAITGSNMVVNGGMTVAQRGVSVTGVTGGVNTFSLDRWVYDGNNSATLTLSQDADAPDGFNYSLKAQVTTADGAYGSGTDYARITQKIEGYNGQKLGLGESWAKPFVVSFWVKSSVAGGYSCTVYSETTNNYHNAGSYQVNSANTWEYKTVSFSAHSSGSVGNTTNGSNLRVQFHLNKAGPTYSGTQNTWVNSVVISGTSDQNTWISTLNSTFQITGVCLNVGDSAIDFPHESYGETLAKCQRYYQQPSAAMFGTITNGGGSFTNLWFTRVLPVEMRASPAVSVLPKTIQLRVWGGTTGNTSAGDRNFDGSTITTINSASYRKNSISGRFALPSNITRGELLLDRTEDGTFSVDAEL
jgi:hypothetical protein